MRRKIAKKGFGFKPSIDYIRETMDMPAYFKLEWLEEINAFMRKALSEKKRKIWEKFRRGEI